MSNEQHSDESDASARQRISDVARRLWGRTVRAAETARGQVSVGVDLAQLKRQQLAQQSQIGKLQREIGGIVASLNRDPASPIKFAGVPELESVLSELARREDELRELGDKLVSARGRLGAQAGEPDPPGS